MTGIQIFKIKTVQWAVFHKSTSSSKEQHKFLTFISNCSFQKRHKNAAPKYNVEMSLIIKKQPETTFWDSFTWLFDQYIRLHTRINHLYWSCHSYESTVAELKHSDTH
jgi:hypothetical protein